MKREQLGHVLRAASRIAEDPDVVVIGSKSILAAIPEDRLPREATASMESTAGLINPATVAARIDRERETSDP